jgi:hypothetical protein
VPELINDYRGELREQLRQWRSGKRSEADSVVRRSGVAAAVATIREATKVALVAAAIGLLCAGLALVLRENPSEKVFLRVTVEYDAALLFFLAVSVTHNGVWGERQDRMLVPHDDWPGWSTPAVPADRGHAVARRSLASAAATPPGELVGLDDPAGQHRTIGLEPLTHDLQAEFVKTTERAQVGGQEGSVRHVAPIGLRGMSRCRHAYRVD